MKRSKLHCSWTNEYLGTIGGTGTYLNPRVWVPGLSKGNMAKIEQKNEEKPCSVFLLPIIQLITGALGCVICVKMLKSHDYS